MTNEEITKVEFGTLDINDEFKHNHIRWRKTSDLCALDLDDTKPFNSPHFAEFAKHVQVQPLTKQPT